MTRPGPTADDDARLMAVAPYRHLVLPPASVRLDPARVRARIDALPPLPKALAQALTMLHDDRTSTAACAETIARDQALTARTLRLANSAFYGVPGRVGTVRDALHILGRRALGSLLTSSALAAQLPVHRCAGFDFGAFWTHALGSAIAAQSLAVGSGLDADLAFTAGLLHDVGRLAMAAYFPEALEAALAQARDRDCSDLEMERTVVGIDHAQVGGLIAARWHFPDDVVAAIRDHHAPPDPLAGGRRAPELTDLVHLANAIAHALDLEGNADDRVPPIAFDAWARVCAAPDELLHAFARTEAGVAVLRDALDLPGGSKR